MTPIRTRIAPSPTGKIHVGTIRTALFNYLFAKNQGGTFILRIEDTDTERSTKENENLIYEGLRWTGLHWDEGPDCGGKFGPYHQMERLELYQHYTQKLLESGNAYWCYDTPEELAAEREAQQAAKQPPKYSRKGYSLTETEKKAYEAEGRPKTLRFLIPEKQLTVNDAVRGTVTFDTSLISDPIILKSNGIPAYNFANVVDDHEMQITHIIRGDEHFSNLPIQVLIYEALSLPLPTFAHASVILNPDRSKMSKRRNEGVLDVYREKGYLPEALVNFLSLLGWSPGNDDEHFTLAELEQRFTLDGLQASPATLQEEKLQWFNGHYIRSLKPDELYQRALPFIPKSWAEKPDRLSTFLTLIQERLVYLAELPDLLHFAFEDITLSSEILTPKKRTATEAKTALSTLTPILENLTWDEETLEQTLRQQVENLGWKTGELFMLLRIAVTGSKATPPLFATMVALGKDLCLQRLHQAQTILTS